MSVLKKKVSRDLSRLVHTHARASEDALSHGVYVARTLLSRQDDEPCVYSVHIGCLDSISLSLSLVQTYQLYSIYD